MNQPNGAQPTKSEFNVEVSRIEGTDKTVLSMSITLGPAGLVPLIQLLQKCLSSSRNAIVLSDAEVRN